MLPAPPPNIVVFLVDDLGLMDTSVPFLTDASGQPKHHPLNSYYRTPYMQDLAARGVRFSTFYAMSVCSPSRISIMSGQNASRHHTTQWINPISNNRGAHGPVDWRWQGLSKSDVTLPRVLREQGYETIFVGKAHFGPTPHEGSEPLNLGFDVNIGGSAIGEPGSYYGTRNYGNPGTHPVPHLDKYHGTETFLSKALTLEANAALQRAVAKGKPFFLYFGHYAVHTPFDSDPRFEANYAASGKPARARAFATLIEGMDKSLGDVLRTLDELKVANNTLVFFLGDNGSDAPLDDGKHDTIASSAPLRGKKGTRFEGGMRVPFLAAWARPNTASPYQQKLPIRAGSVQRQFGAVYDLFPTIVELVGATVPSSHVVDGSSLGTLLAGAQDSSRAQSFLMHFPHSHRNSYFTSYRDGDWKVVYQYPVQSAAGAPGTYELFQLAQDPSESENLAQQNPSQLRRMMQGMFDALEAHQAQYPVNKAKLPLRPQLP